ncbi:MAG: DNA polymerase III subunit gamma/tau [Candidatus Staskawiczbacteria bacterium]|nr:DNA polymerase III subunit gamma/tau [Candidatus Staskawiczbacteria bacterium]MBI3337294.1 DNA polymerase III subunit gamma/tau [Candidatus Staskawiczbacteria bacterium]
MNNLVLYRKYRPQSFSEIIGQEHIVQTLTNSISAKSISHAYLFTGPRGSGKTTIARLFAKAINCHDLSSFEPCNKCSSCLEIMQSKSMDLIEIDAASHTGVDDVRELIEGIKFSPVKSKYKIFIIDECHQLSKSAANALLKTLEEPPGHAIFILATTEVHKMIPTIISRCQRFDFKRLQISEIIKKLEFISKKENIKFEDSALSLIAFNSRGSFRDAESLLDQCISFSGKTGAIKTDDIKELLGIVEASQIAQLVDYLSQKNTKDSILYLNSMADNGIDLQEFTKTLVFYLRQSLLLKINPDFLNLQNSGLSDKEIEKMKNQTANLNNKDIQNMLELFIEAENKMKYSAIPQLPLELAIVDITYEEV